MSRIGHIDLVLISSNNERCLRRLKASIFPVQSSCVSPLPHGFSPQVFEVDCGKTEKIPARRLF